MAMNLEGQTQVVNGHEPKGTDRQVVGHDPREIDRLLVAVNLERQTGF